MKLEDHIRTIPDFPKPGIMFRDISTLYAHPEAWRHAVERMAEEITIFSPTKLIGIEARGFPFAAAIAMEIDCGFVMARKKGKLPGPVTHHNYDLEYGSACIEMQADAISSDDNIVLIDDLLATGGTAAAATTLVRKLGGQISAAVFAIELAYLNGRAALNVPVRSLIVYEGE